MRWERVALFVFSEFGSLVTLYGVAIVAGAVMWLWRRLRR